METFDPTNPDYKEVADLSAEEQAKYSDVPEGGFVEKSAAENLAKAKEEAKQIDSYRSWKDKIFGQNKKDPMDIVQTEALKANEIWDRKNTKETDSEKIVEHNLKVFKNELDHVWKGQVFLPSPIAIADEKYIGVIIDGVVRPETGQVVMLGSTQNIPEELKTDTQHISFWIGVMPVDKSSSSPTMQIERYDAPGISAPAEANIKQTLEAWNSTRK